MKDDINLISHSLGGKKGKSTLTLISIVIFSIFFTISIVLVLYSLLLNQKANNLVTQENDLKSRISTFSVRRNKLALTSDRLVSIGRILSARGKIDERMASILSAFPVGLSIKNISADESTVSLDINSDSLLEIDNFLEQKLPAFSKTKPLGLKLVEIESFVRRFGQYILSIKFYYT